MAVKTINTELLQKMFLAGAANLEAKKEFINELNVFPVPDGDTGTNMTLTILSAAKEVKALENPDMVAIAKAISSGSLRGARGNSGVILSANSKSVFGAPSFFVALQRRSGNIKRLTQLHLRRHVNVQLQLLIRLL